MEHGGSWPCHTCPPPAPILSHLNPVHTTISHSLKIHLNIILPSSPRSSKWSLFLKVLHPYPVYASTLPHTCHMPRPSHSQFYHLNNIRWRVQIIKLLIMLFSPLPFYFIHLRPKYTPQHPQLMSLPQYEQPSFTPIQNNKQNYSSVYLNL